MSAESPAPKRLVMVRQTSNVHAHENCAHTGIRRLMPDDGERLGSLMYEAYQGTVDDEGASLQEAIEEAKGTLSGKYGKVLYDASFTVETESNELASVCVITDYEKLQPLLAFSLTKPTHQKQGLARCLIEKSLLALNAANVPVLHLVVTQTNHNAIRLYKTLGFTDKN
ncbi:MAG TPA: GNAT family N-acetyltransferase [Drouetiella sp.]